MNRLEKTPLNIIGAGGHAKVVIQTARAAGYEPIAVFDDDERLHETQVCGVPVVGKIAEMIERLKNSDLACVIAIGNNETRKMIAEKYDQNWVSIIHPSAIVDATAQIGAGTVVFAQAVIQADATIGRHVIVNTSASIDHDCHLADFVHIAPGCHLSGGVHIGEGTLLGVGACAKPLAKVGRWSVIGAGAAIIRNIPDHVTAVGVPARFRRTACQSGWGGQNRACCLRVRILARQTPFMSLQGGMA